MKGAPQPSKLSPFLLTRFGSEKLGERHFQEALEKEINKEIEMFLKKTQSKREQNQR